MKYDAGKFSFEIDVAFEVDEKLRRVFALTQNKKGDVYVRIISGLRRGESSTGSLIREDRISLHVSNNSQDYNTFKKTTSTVDGESEIIVQLNTAVKSGIGFAHLTSVMFSDLAAPVYDISSAKKEKPLVLGEFDPKSHTVCCAIFVGAPGVEFSRGPVPYEIFKINTAHFQVVIVGGLVSVPAIAYARTFLFGTVPPDHPFLGRRERARRLQNMQSKTPDECLNAFSKNIGELLNYRNDYLRVIMTESIAEIQCMLDSATPEQVLSLESLMSEAKMLLEGIKPSTQYLYAPNGTSKIVYVDEQGKFAPL